MNVQECYISSSTYLNNSYSYKLQHPPSLYKLASCFKRHCDIFGETMKLTKSLTASSSSVPSAIMVTSSPLPNANVINPIILLALIRFPSFSKNKSAAYFFTSFIYYESGLVSSQV